MNALGKKAVRRYMKQQINDEMINYVEHCDLVVLWVLHNVFGFGEKRLRKYYRAFMKLYDEFQNRYKREDDIQTLGERGDSVALKAKLKEIGFDYDKEIEEAKNEMENN